MICRLNQITAYLILKNQSAAAILEILRRIQDTCRHMCREGAKIVIFAAKIGTRYFFRNRRSETIDYYMQFLNMLRFDKNACNNVGKLDSVFLGACLN